MHHFLKDIKIVGGIHNERGGNAPAELTQEKLDLMVADLSVIIAKHTRQDSYITVEYVVSSGCKVNS